MPPMRNGLIRYLENSSSLFKNLKSAFTFPCAMSSICVVGLSVRINTNKSSIRLSFRHWRLRTSPVLLRCLWQINWNRTWSLNVEMNPLSIHSLSTSCWCRQLTNSSNTVHTWFIGSRGSLSPLCVCELRIWFRISLALLWTHGKPLYTNGIRFLAHCWMSTNIFHVHPSCNLPRHGSPSTIRSTPLAPRSCSTAAWLRWRMYHTRALMPKPQLILNANKRRSLTGESWSIVHLYYYQIIFGWNELSVKERVSQSYNA